MNQEPWTILRLLNWTADYFHKKGIENSRLETEVLLAHLLRLKRIDLYTHFDRALEATELAAFKALIQERLSGRPTSYIVGHKEFMSLDFLVNEHVLIPRPETETLVETAVEILGSIVESEAGGVVVTDLCTGCGCVACSIATYAPGAKVFAVDSSPEALEVAKKNVERLGLREQVSLLLGDLFEPLEGKLPRLADMIVSNPPYISEKDFLELDPGIRNFEPREALLAGPTGTEVHEKIARQALKFLSPGGHLLMEVASGQFESVKTMLQTSGSYSDILAAKDFSGIDRVVIARGERKWRSTVS